MFENFTTVYEFLSFLLKVLFFRIAMKSGSYEYSFVCASLDSFLRLLLFAFNSWSVSASEGSMQHMPQRPFLKACEFKLLEG